MSIYTYNPNDRYRQRSAQRMVSLFTVLIFTSVIGGAGFWIGWLQAEQRIHVLVSEKQDIYDQYTALQEEITKVRAEAQTANLRLEQLRASYEEVIPAGPMQDLTLLLKQQLDEGIDARRLESVIRLARPPQNCSEPEMRRFVVSTPSYKGPDSKISILSGAIGISGSGEAATNEKGNPEAWFDSAKSVRIVFGKEGGEEEVKEGVLPLHHAIIHGDKEFRFTVAPGAQSFAKVTFDSCDYP